MRFWPRPSVSHNVAAARFVRDTIESTLAGWPLLSSELAPFLDEWTDERPDLLADHWTGYYFALARIAWQLQLLPSVVPKRDATLVRLAVIMVLRGDDRIAVQVDKFFLAFEEASRLVAGQEDGPIVAIGATIFDALELDDLATGVEDALEANPLVLSALTTVIAKLGVDWWPRFLEDYRLA